MCWTCDHPGSTRADFYVHMADIVQRCGWAVQFVERWRDRPPFAYTVGLTLRGLPELVVTALAARRSQQVLNDEAARILVDGAPRPGERRLLVSGETAEVVDVPHPDAHLHTAIALLGTDVRAVQLVRADDRGRWPWEVGHRAGRGGQPVLGPRATS